VLRAIEDQLCGITVRLSPDYTVLVIVNSMLYTVYILIISQIPNFND